MRSIKSKVIASLFALCFAFLGYSCQCNAQAQPEEPEQSEESEESEEIVVSNAIVFYSSSAFSLETGNNKANWKTSADSTNKIEWCSADSENDEDWKEWDGTKIDAVLNSNKYYTIYLRGKENTIITGKSSSNRFVINSDNQNAKVILDGNIMNLLDYTKDYSKPENLGLSKNYCFAYLFHKCTKLAILGPNFSLPATTLTQGCYSNMFQGCTSLKTAPALPATTLSSSCYYYMFQDCTSLTSVPALPAQTLVNGCYNYMFNGCILIMLSETKTEEYVNEFKIGDATDTSSVFTHMFSGTGGSFAATPSGGATYWTSNTVVSVN